MLSKPTQTFNGPNPFFQDGPLRVSLCSQDLIIHRIRWSTPDKPDSSFPDRDARDRIPQDRITQDRTI